MALTESSMTNLGSVAKPFTLPDTISGLELSLDKLKGNVGTVIMFISNHCPYVKHINKALVETAHEFIPLGVSFVAISSNDAKKHPEDSPEKMTEVAIEEKYPFPYLHDASQEVAKAYQAVCTPDIFVYDKNLKMVYRGRIDDTRPGRGIASANELKGALRAIVADQFVSEIQYPSVGCGIKWK